MRRKIRCFACGKRSDIQRQQQDVNSRRTAEESRTTYEVAGVILSMQSGLDRLLIIIDVHNLERC